MYTGVASVVIGIAYLLKRGGNVHLDAADLVVVISMLANLCPFAFIGIGACVYLHRQIWELLFG